MNLRRRPRAVPAGLIVALALSAAACERAGPAEDQMPVAPAQPIEGAPPPATGPAAGPASSTGPTAGTPASEAAGPVTLSPSADDMLQWSAAVTEVHPMPNQGAKLFSTAGGDPALNGLYTYLALFQGAAEGWRVFQLGDFESWRVLEEAPGRVLIEVRQSTLDPTTGQAVTATRRLSVSFDAAAPESVTVTPAG